MPGPCCIVETISWKQQQISATFYRPNKNIDERHF